MFEYAKIKAELEQVKCRVHAKTALVVFTEGRMVFENVCCDEHRKKLEEAFTDMEQQNVADILEDVY